MTSKELQALYNQLDKIHEIAEKLWTTNTCRPS